MIYKTLESIFRLVCNIKIRASWIKLVFLSLCFFFSPYGITEVTLDGSMGTAGALNGPDFEITENLGKRAGNNLFHSFGKFNLNSTESATFSGSADINNVISRVTGGQVSSIDGTLRVTIPSANLYLLNPTGIIFGQNAKLDVPGSFHTSTADFLKFQGGVQFNSSSTSANPILTIASPEAFGFLEETPASISLTGGNDTVLEVASGKTLSLVGGNISIKDASLNAPGGQVNLISVASAGEVGFTESGLDTASFEKMGNISISQDPLILRTVGGQNITLANVDVSADIAGKVFIRGGQMVMENAKIESNTINGDSGGINIALKGDLNIDGIAETPVTESTPLNGLFTFSFGKGKASNIILDIEGLLKLTHGAKITSIPGSSGNGGDLIINANTLFLEGTNSKTNAQIATSSGGTGRAGNITITTSGLLKMTGGTSIGSISSDGNTGEVIIDTHTLEMKQSSILNFTAGSENGGNINIKATDIISLTGPDGGILNQTNGSGDSGAIIINADKLHIQNGTLLATSTGGSGNTGDLLINSNEIILTNDEKLVLQNTNGAIRPTGISSQIFDIDKNGTATGNSGDLIIKANNLTVSNGAKISTTNLGLGNSGTLSVDSNKILLTTDQQFRSDSSMLGAGIKAERSFGQIGNSGNLIVNADDLVVEHGTEISTSNFGDDSGHSGDLLINSENITLSRNGNTYRTGIFNTNFGAGNLGKLAINSKNIQIKNGARIGAETQADGNGGNLSITTERLEMHDGANVDVSTFSSGQGGDLTLTVDHLNIRDSAVISTSTFGLGDSGNLEVNAQTIFIKGDQTGNFTGISSQSNVADSGNAGDLKVHTDFLEIRDNARISASTFGAGQAGNLTIDADNILLHHARLESTSDLENIDILKNPNIAMSGNVDITVHDRLNLENKALISVKTKKSNSGMVKIGGEGTLLLKGDSKIITSVAKGKGKGGDILIQSPVVTLDNSSIEAKAIEGDGGNITISGIILHTPLSVVSASSELSMDGDIQLKPDTNISGDITELPDTVMDASSQISERCTARQGDNLSSFVVKQGAGLAAKPGDLASSNILDYTPAESISVKKSGSTDGPFSSLKNNTQLPVMAKGCVE